jgi:hypothetical protein
MLKNLTRRQTQLLALGVLAFLLLVGVSLVYIRNRHRYAQVLSKPVATTNPSQEFGVKDAPVAKGATSKATGTTTYTPGAGPPTSASTQETNAQRTVLINFYTDYTKNKDNQVARQNLISQYGTQKFKDNSQTKNGFDPVVCGNAYPQSISITGNLGDGNRMTYSFKLVRLDGSAFEIQAVVLKSGDQYLIDTVNCPGEV